MIQALVNVSVWTKMALYFALFRFPSGTVKKWRYNCDCKAVACHMPTILLHLQWTEPFLRWICDVWLWCLQQSRTHSGCEWMGFSRRRFSRSPRWPWQRGVLQDSLRLIHNSSRCCCRCVFLKSLVVCGDADVLQEITVLLHTPYTGCFN